MNAEPQSPASKDHQRVNRHRAGRVRRRLNHAVELRFYSDATVTPPIGSVINPIHKVAPLTASTANSPPSGYSNSQ